MRREEKINFGIILRIGLSLLPILFGMTLPAMILCAFNIAMSFVVFGPKTSIVSSMCAICISMFFCSGYGNGAEVEGLFLALESILCAYACIYTIVKKKDFYSGVWLASAGYLIPSMISLKNSADNMGMSIAQYLVDIPTQMLKLQFEQLSGEAGAALDISVAEKIIDTSLSVTVMVIPSILIVVSIVVGYTVMWSVISRLRMLPIKHEHSFSTIRIQRIMVIIMLGAFVLFVLNMKSDLAYVFVNVFAILASLCLFAGISFVDYYLRIPVKNVIVRLIFYAVALLFAGTFVIPALCILAIVDSFADFRKIGRKELE